MDPQKQQSVLSSYKAISTEIGDVAPLPALVQCL